MKYIIILALLILTACGGGPKLPDYTDTEQECIAVSLQYGEGHRYPGVGVTIGAPYVWDGQTCLVEIGGKFILQ